MPYQYDIYEGHRLIHERAIGTVTDEEFLQSFTGPTADVPLDLTYDVISDYRRCQSKISAEAVRRASEIYASYYSRIPHGKWAVLRSRETGNLNADFFTFLAGNPKIRSFPSVKEALAWLDLPEDLIE